MFNYHNRDIIRFTIPHPHRSKSAMNTRKPFQFDELALLAARPLSDLRAEILAVSSSASGVMYLSDKDGKAAARFVDRSMILNRWVKNREKILEYAMSTPKPEI